MKTDDLVRLLAADRLVERRSAARAAAIAYPLCLLALAAAFVAFLGPRPGFGDPQILAITAMKLAITLTLAVSGVLAAFKAARPDAGAYLGWRVAAPALVLLAMALVYDIASVGAAGWQARLVGQHNWRCLIDVTVLSVAPLATTLFVLRRGVVTRQTMAGAVAGLAATGIGASFYALNCTDDSPLFMLAWYGAAGLIVVALGILAARRLLRW